MNYQIGDTVMFFHSEDEIWPGQQRECPAIITGLNTDGTVDLATFPRGRNPSCETSVLRYALSDYETPPRGAFWDYISPVSADAAGSGSADD